MRYPVVDEFAIEFDFGHRQGENTRMLDLGFATSTGDNRQAIDLLTEALAVDRDTGYRHGDPCVLDSLGRAGPGRAWAGVR